MGYKKMSLGKYDYRLTISKSVYFQDGEEFPVDVPYLNFQQDGEVTLTGSDEVGEFNFTGHAEEDYLFLNKAYVGQHTVYYVGKLEENKLNLFYAFEEDQDGGKAKVDGGEFNALMEFESEQFRFFRDGTDNDSFQIFLRTDENGKSKGLGRIKGKTVKLSYKKKDDGMGKIQMKYKEYEKTFKVERNDDNNDLIVTQCSNNEYTMEAVQSFYLIEGMEYSFYLPRMTFMDDGMFCNTFTDNNGTFTISGQFVGEFLEFTKSYDSGLCVWLVGKFTGTRLEMAYSFEEGHTEEMQGKVDAGEYMAYTELNLNHYMFEIEEQRVHTFLIADGEKHRGFCIMEGKMYIISMKTKEGKPTKLKMKRDKEVRYVRCDVDHEFFTIVIAGAMPMGMGL